MKNYFHEALNKNTIEAIQNNAAFFMKQHGTRIPIINGSFTDTSVTGASYFNLMLSGGTDGGRRATYEKMSKALFANIEQFSARARENTLRGFVLQEEDYHSKNPRYSFVIQAAQPNHEHVTRKGGYVPYQTNDAKMDDFENFVREQCANAINASFTNCAFRSNIQNHDMEQFKAALVNEIAKNPAFMASIANRAYQEVVNHHYLPFDKKEFIEKARNENSREFSRLNSAISEHIHDMRRNGKQSFNREFDELSRPLVINIENLYLGGKTQNKKSAVEGKITEFVREKIKQDKPASVLVDTFIGTFIQKAQYLVKDGKRVFAGLVLACSLINPVLTATMQTGDFLGITDNIVAMQELKGDKELTASRDNKDTRSFYSSFNEIIRDNPQTLNKAISQLNKANHNQHQKTPQAAAMARK